MKNMKYARTLVTLALVLVVLGSIVGGTIAWFTDEVESANNIVKSGTLDMTVGYSDTANGPFADLEKATEPLFNYEYWEPGYTQVKYLKVANVGDLAFKYMMNVKANSDPDVLPNPDLAKMIDVYFDVVDADFVAPAKAADLANMNKAGNVRELMGIDIATAPATGILLPVSDKQVSNAELPDDDVALEGEVVYCIALHMQETAGNEYQNLPVGDGFSLDMLATQYTYEKDTFDNSYDKEAGWPNDLPVAGMNPITGDDRVIIIGDRLGTLDGVPTDMYDPDTNKLKLDCGLVFTSTETPADIVGQPYEFWNADFTVSVSKPITKDDCRNGVVPLILLGQYDMFGEAWIPIPITANDDFQVKADEPVRLLAMTDNLWSYKNVLSIVNEFQCGVKADPSWAVPGTQVHVQLRVYEVDENGNENGKSHIVKDYIHTY